MDLDFTRFRSIALTPNALAMEIPNVTHRNEGISWGHIRPDDKQNKTERTNVFRALFGTILVLVKILGVCNPFMTEENLLAMKENYLEEMEAISSSPGILQHVYIVFDRVDDAWSDTLIQAQLITSQTPYKPKVLGVVMEYLPGGTLFDLLHVVVPHEPPLPTNTCMRLRILLEISEAIFELHSHGIIHGDIRPSNMCLSARDWFNAHVKLMGFGIASIQPSQWEERMSTQITANIQHGVWNYIAPELYGTYRTGPVPPDELSDIFSLGILMWEVLTNIIPWQRGNSVQRVLQLRKGIDFLDIKMSSLPDDTPEHIVNCIIRCIDINVTVRPTMMEVIEWLRSAVISFEPVV